MAMWKRPKMIDPRLSIGYNSRITSVMHTLLVSASTKISSVLRCDYGHVENTKNERPPRLLIGYNILLNSVMHALLTYFHYGS